MSAKITYVNGSYLQPGTLNGYLGTSAATGHVHDGGSDATCAPKIDLPSCVSGVIPSANLGLIDSTNLYLADSTFICPLRAVGGGATVNVTMHYVKNTYGTVKMWYENISGLQSDIVHKSTTTVLNTYSLTPGTEREIVIKVGAFGVTTTGSFVAMIDGYLVLSCTTTGTAYVSQAVEYML